MSGDLDDLRSIALIGVVLWAFGAGMVAGLVDGWLS